MNRKMNLNTKNSLVVLRMSIMLNQYNIFLIGVISVLDVLLLKMMIIHCWAGESMDSFFHSATATTKIKTNNYFKVKKVIGKDRSLC